jgi:hypothetical protein
LQPVAEHSLAIIGSHGAAAPHMQLPDVQRSASTLLQFEQVSPPVPQFDIVLPAAQVVPLQQPVHEVESQTHEPMLQCCPVEQLFGVSSVVPSQSSSSSLQSSVVLPVLSLHVVPFPATLQMTVPSSHMSVSPPSQSAPRVNPSSIVPSQSLSA